jgi:hypothetical protein
MDYVFDLPYARSPRTELLRRRQQLRRRDQTDWEMIRFRSTSCVAALAAAQLLDHRARRPHYSEPFRGIGDPAR